MIMDIGKISAGLLNITKHSSLCTANVSSSKIKQEAQSFELKSVFIKIVGKLAAHSM
jgi:hypothetical protein